jgi:hypothetical protein
MANGNDFDACFDDSKSAFFSSFLVLMLQRKVQQGSIIVIQLWQPNTEEHTLATRTGESKNPETTLENEVLSTQCEHWGM